MKKLIAFFALVFIMSMIASACENGMVPDGDGGIVNLTPSPTSRISDLPIVSATQMPETTFFENLGEGIDDFAEGTVEKIEDLPEIVAAIGRKFKDATVTGITQALHLDEQVYAVKFTDKDGKTHTAYVSPDGKTVTEDTDVTASESGN